MGIVVSLLSCSESKSTSQTETKRHWYVNATENQISLINKLWGKSLSIDELFRKVFPNVRQELPAFIYGNKTPIQWPSVVVDWNRPVSGNITMLMTGEHITSGKSSKYSESRISTKLYVLYYFIGKENMEKFPILSTYDSQDVESYFVSIYIPN